MNDLKREFDCIILGAGAAGLMCAIEAAKRRKKVIVLDHSDRPGKKILISGGGRCNFTNINTAPDRFLSSNPHFVKSALAQYRPEHFLEVVQRYNIPYHEKTLGQLFCDRSAHDILNMLLQECEEEKVVISLQTRILEIEKNSDYLVNTSKGSFSAPALVVATGGLSIPKMGATGLGYEIAEQFGLELAPTRPGLVPFLFSHTERKQWSDLSGVSAEVIAFIGKKQFREKMLITHRGVSGPAILQISSYWQPGTEVCIDLCPQQNPLQTLLSAPSGRDWTALRSALRSFLPQRIADRWLERSQPEGWSNSALESYQSELHQWNFTPADTEGFEKAEVTVGGVDTKHLQSRTMECKQQSGLFFIGEVVDVTGHLGGYNFQWAWASGAAAGRAV